MRPREPDHRVDVVSIHVRENTGSITGKWIRQRLFIVLCIYPPHYAKTSNIVEVDCLKPKEAEVGEIDPVSTVLVASKVFLSNGSYIMVWHWFSIADHGRPGGSKRISTSRLCYEQAASRVGFQILSMHGHIAYEENGPAGRIQRERHQ